MSQMFHLLQVDIGYSIMKKILQDLHLVHLTVRNYGQQQQVHQVVVDHGTKI